MKKQWHVKPGDLVRQGTWDSDGGDIGRVLAVAPIAGRDWPDVLVILPGGEVRTWHRWGKVSDEEASQLDWIWHRGREQ
jgi:hypothetical protein